MRHTTFGTFLLLGLAATLFPASLSSQADGDAVTLGTYRVVHSDIMNEDRVLQVHLPRGYQESELAYPVVYLFYSDLVELYYADAVTALQHLGMNFMPQVILVGVANNVDRYRDLLPWPTRDGYGGQADRFLRFVREELLPFVDAEYRTKDYRIMVGPQAAGVFGAYALVKDPGLFQAFVLNDPCVIDSDERSLCAEVVDFAASHDAEGTFFAVSHGGSRDSQASRRLEQMRADLGSHAVSGFRWSIEVDGDWRFFVPPLHLEDHLLGLFPDFPFPADREVHSLSDVLSHYEDLSRRFGFTVDPPDLILAQAADRLARTGHRDAALEVLKHQLALYPASLNPLWRLANLYREMGDTANAIRYYRQCLEREPNMTPAKTWLERLGAGG
jgi:predicted alpha/beta superfamily hydrolase